MPRQEDTEYYHQRNAEHGRHQHQRASDSGERRAVPTWFTRILIGVCGVLLTGMAAFALQGTVDCKAHAEKTDAEISAIKNDQATMEARLTTAIDRMEKRVEKIQEKLGAK